MADLMIDIETLNFTPDATILNIAAQSFDPLGKGHFDRHYYARIDLESQQNRSIDNSTIEWWATQHPDAQEEAFGEANRVPLKEALDELVKMVWQSNIVWVNGVGFDTVILENAFIENGIHIPWKFYMVRDCRTVFGLWPDLPKPPTSHHALEDCRRQILMLQDTLKHLGIEKLK